jgi:hypothetical protein
MLDTGRNFAAWDNIFDRSELSLPRNLNQGKEKKTFSPRANRSTENDFNWLLVNSIQGRAATTNSLEQPGTRCRTISIEFPQD